MVLLFISHFFFKSRTCPKTRSKVLFYDTFYFCFFFCSNYCFIIFLAKGKNKFVLTNEFLIEERPFQIKFSAIPSILSPKLKSMIDLFFLEKEKNTVTANFNLRKNSNFSIHAYLENKALIRWQ